MPDGLHRLDQAIEDLNSIQKGNHSDTKLYEAVTRNLTHLSSILRKYYSKDGAAAPVLDADALKVIRDAYSDAGRACADYLSGKGTTRSSGYGQGRLHCIREIGRIISEDLAAVQAVRPEGGTTLRSVIEDARRMDLALKDPDRIATVGGAMNSRIPVSMETAQDTVEGFFTKSTYQSKFVDVANHFYKKYGAAQGMAPVLGKYCSGDPTKMSASQLEAYYRQLITFDIIRDKVYTNAIKHGMNCSSANMIGSMKDFNDVFGQALIQLYGVPHAKLLVQNEEARKNFVDFIDDIENVFRPYMLNRMVVGIKDGEEIQKRNVGMSRVADALGMQGLIARSVPAKMKIGGREENGIFMERVNGVSDLMNVTKEDPLLTLGDDPEQIDTPEVLRQLSDLQVLDYVCGNTDRHDRNIMYRFEQVDGKWQLCGIAGIDNDMSLGELAPGKNSLIDISTMRVMRRSTAEAIAAMDEKKLRLLLQDLDPTEAEIKSAMQRIGELQKELQKTAGRRIEILEDEQFAERKAKEFCAKREGGRAAGNYFDNLLKLPERAKEVVREKARRIRFNRAEVIPKNDRDSGLPIYAADLSNTRRELRDALQLFKTSKRFMHKDTGSFKWMRDSMQELADQITLLEAKYNGAEGAALEKEDAETIERLYRQLRNASSEYVRTHPEYKKEGTMGAIRKAQAEHMTKFYPPRFEKAEKVREMNFDEIVEIKTGEQGGGRADIGEKSHQKSRSSGTHLPSGTVNSNSSGNVKSNTFGIVTGKQNRK